MTIEELALEYDNQYKVLRTKLDALKPLLCVYKGTDLLLLRKKMKIYYTMALECKNTALMLGHYYEREDI